MIAVGREVIGMSWGKTYEATAHCGGSLFTKQRKGEDRDITSAE